MAGVASSSRSASWIRSACASGVQSVPRGRRLWPYPGRSKTMTRYFLAALSRSPLELEVLDHAAVAVQQDERLALATLDVVQADSIDLEELSLWGIAALRILCKPSVHQGRDGECRDANRCCGRVGVISEVRQLLACARPGRRQTTLRVQYFHEAFSVWQRAQPHAESMLQCNIDLQPLLASMVPSETGRASR